MVKAKSGNNVPSDLAEYLGLSPASDGWEPRPPSIDPDRVRRLSRCLIEDMGDETRLRSLTVSNVLSALIWFSELPPLEAPINAETIAELSRRLTPLGFSEEFLKAAVQHCKYDRCAIEYFPPILTALVPDWSPSEFPDWYCEAGADPYISLASLFMKLPTAIPEVIRQMHEPVVARCFAAALMEQVLRDGKTPSDYICA